MRWKGAPAGALAELEKGRSGWTGRPTSSIRLGDGGVMRSDDENGPGRGGTVRGTRRDERVVLTTKNDSEVRKCGPEGALQG